MTGSDTEKRDLPVISVKSPGRLDESSKELNREYGRVCSWIDRSFLFILLSGFILFSLELAVHPEYGKRITEMCTMKASLLLPGSDGRGAVREWKAISNILISPSYRVLYFSVILFASASALGLLALSFMFLKRKEYSASVFSVLTFAAIVYAAAGSFISG